MEQQAQSRKDNPVPHPSIPTVQSQVPQPDRTVPEPPLRHIGTTHRRIYYRQIASHPAQPDVRRDLPVPSQRRKRNRTQQAHSDYLWQRTDKNGVPKGSPIHRGEIHRALFRPRRDYIEIDGHREMQGSEARLTTPYETVDGVTTCRDNAQGGVPLEEGAASEETVTLISGDRSETSSLLEDPEAIPVQPILLDRADDHGSP